MRRGSGRMWRLRRGISGRRRAPVRLSTLRRRLRKPLRQQRSDGDQENFADNAKHEALEEGRHEAREEPDQRVHAEDTQQALDDTRKER